MAVSVPVPVFIRRPRRAARVKGVACSIGLFVSLTTWTFLCAQPASPKTQPSFENPSDLGGIFRQLSDPNWRLRDNAVVKLLELGDSIESQLVDFARNTESAEARERIVRIQAKLVDRHRLDPTLITLNVEKMIPKDVFAAISRKGHFPIMARRESLWEDRPFDLLDLNLVDRPYWEAVKIVCERSKLKPVFEGGDAGAARITLVPDQTGDMSSPHTVAGSFLVVLNTLTRDGFGEKDANADVDLGLTFYADPKWRVLHHPQQTDLLEVLAADGKALPVPKPMTMQVFRSSSPIWSMRGTLPGVPVQTATLARIAGQFKIELLEMAPAVEVPNILAVNSKLCKTAGQFLQITNVHPEGPLVHVRATLTRIGLDDAEWRLQQEIDGITLIATTGKAMDRSGVETQVDGNQLTIDLSYDASGQAADKLVWQMPLKTREVKVQFEFKNAPLYVRLK